MAKQLELTFAMERSTQNTICFRQVAPDGDGEPVRGDKAAVLRFYMHKRDSRKLGDPQRVRVVIEAA